MMATSTIYWLHTLSPTHVGTGRGVGYIDLPVHRDKVTNWPIIPGSAFKGVWADSFRATKGNRESNRELRLAFGLASDADNSSNAGALMPTDARLVCLPVRSFQGTFAWCTSPLALKMLHRDLSLAGMRGELPPHPPHDVAEDSIHHPPGTALKEDGRIYLEDLDFEAQECQVAKNWAEKIAGWVFKEDNDKPWRDAFIKRFAVLPDSVFDFLTETGTEVSARVRIDDEKKIVAKGQLWNEEALPAETVLCGLICCDRVYAKDQEGVTAAGLVERYASAPLTLQIGGKATVGRGRVRCVFTSIDGGADDAQNK